jgi:hypothetical protein
MPRCVFGSVEEQSESGRWQARAADTPRLAQRRFICRRQLRKSAPNDCIPLGEKHVERRERIARSLLAREFCTLISRERLAACVREQPIRRAGQMHQVKANRRRTTRSLPEPLR